MRKYKRLLAVIVIIAMISNYISIIGEVGSIVYGSEDGALDSLILDMSETQEESKEEVAQVPEKEKAEKTVGNEYLTMTSILEDSERYKGILLANTFLDAEHQKTFDFSNVIKVDVEKYEDIDAIIVDESEFMELPSTSSLSPEESRISFSNYINYNYISISEAEFKSLFDNNGYILIVNDKNEEVARIDSSVDAKDGVYNLHFVKGISNLKFKMKGLRANGSLSIELGKSIAKFIPFTRDEIDSFKNIVISEKIAIQKKLKEEKTEEVLPEEKPEELKSDENILLEMEPKTEESDSAQLENSERYYNFIETISAEKREMNSKDELSLDMDEAIVPEEKPVEESTSELVLTPEKNIDEATKVETEDVSEDLLETEIQPVEEDATIDMDIPEDKVVRLELENSIVLDNTVTKVDLNMSTTTLSTTEDNEVKFDVKLRSNSEKYELFKDPVIEIIFPSDIEKIDIDNMNLLYKNGIDIDYWQLNKTEEGENVLKIVLSGTQEDYGTSLVEGITVSFDAMIKVNNMIASKISAIKYRYTNAYAKHIIYQEKQLDAESCEIEIVGDNGLLKKIDIVDSETNEVLLSSFNTDRDIRKIEPRENLKLKVKETIVNNYKGDVENVVIEGKLVDDSDGKSIYDATINKDSIIDSKVIGSGLSSDISYGFDGEEYTKDIDELSSEEKVNEYKLVLENGGIMHHGDTIEFEYDIQVQSPFDYNQILAYKNVVGYTLNGEKSTDTTIFGFETENKEVTADDLLNYSILKKSEEVTDTKPVVEKIDEVASIDEILETKKEQESITEESVDVDEATEPVTIDSITTPLDDTKPATKEKVEGLDNMLKIGSQVLIGDTEIDGDQVRERQLVKVRTVVKNISNMPLNNVKLEGKAHNGNIFYLNKFTIFSDSTYENITTGKFVEDEDGSHTTESMEIGKINPGEEVVFEYQYITLGFEKMSSPEKTSYAIVSIESDEIGKTEIESKKYNVIDSDIEVVLKKGDLENQDHLLLEAGDDNNYYLAEVKNISSKDMKNVSVRFMLPSSLHLNALTELDGLDVKETSSIDGSIVEVIIPELPSGETKDVYITTVIDELPTYLSRMDATVGVEVAADNQLFDGNNLTREIVQTESVFDAKLVSDRPYATLSDGDIINYTYTIKNNGTVSMDEVLDIEFPNGIVPISGKMIKQGAEYDVTINEVPEIEDKFANNKYISYAYTIDPDETIVFHITARFDASRVDMDTDDLNLVVNSGNESCIAENKAKMDEDVFSAKYLEDGEEQIVDYVDIDTGERIETSDLEEMDYSEISEEIVDEEVSDIEEIHEEIEQESEETTLGEVVVKDESKDFIIAKTSDNNEIKDYTLGNITDKNLPVSTKLVSDEESCIIKGMIWNDADGNGLWSDNEKIMEGNIVKLYDTRNNAIIATTLTDSQGTYKFYNVKAGEYIIMYSYDSSAYKFSKYYSGLSESYIISNVNQSQIVEDADYAISDSIVVRSGEEITVNLGLKELDLLDLKVDSYVSKVTLKKDGKEEAYDYKKGDASELELTSKSLKDSDIVLDYSIEISNIGNVNGYVGQMSVTIPEGFEFDESSSNNWYVDGDKLIYDGSKIGIQNEGLETITVSFVGKTKNSNAEMVLESRINNVYSYELANDSNNDNNYSEATFTITRDSQIVQKIVAIAILTIAFAVLFIIIKKYGNRSIFKFSFTAYILSVVLVALVNKNMAFSYLEMRATGWYNNSSLGYGHGTSYEDNINVIQNWAVGWKFYHGWKEHNDENGGRGDNNEAHMRINEYMDNFYGIGTRSKMLNLNLKFGRGGTFVRGELCLHDSTITDPNFVAYYGYRAIGAADFGYDNGNTDIINQINGSYNTKVFRGKPDNGKGRTITTSDEAQVFAYAGYKMDTDMSTSGGVVPEKYLTLLRYVNHRGWNNLYYGGNYKSAIQTAMNVHITNGYNASEDHKEWLKDARSTIGKFYIDNAKYYYGSSQTPFSIKTVKLVNNGKNYALKSEQYVGPIKVKMPKGSDGGIINNHVELLYSTNSGTNYQKYKGALYTRKIVQKNNNKYYQYTSIASLAGDGGAKDSGKIKALNNIEFFMTPSGLPEDLTPVRIKLYNRYNYYQGRMILTYNTRENVAIGARCAQNKAVIRGRAKTTSSSVVLKVKDNLPVIKITKTALNDYVEQGDVASYKFTVKNEGGYRVESIKFTDVFTSQGKEMPQYVCNRDGSYNRDEYGIYLKEVVNHSDGNITAYKDGKTFKYDRIEIAEGQTRSFTLRYIINIPNLSDNARVISNKVAISTSYKGIETTASNDRYNKGSSVLQATADIRMKMYSVRINKYISKVTHYNYDTNSEFPSEENEVVKDDERRDYLENEKRYGKKTVKNTGASPSNVDYSAIQDSLNEDVKMEGENASGVSSDAARGGTVVETYDDNKGPVRVEIGDKVEYTVEVLNSGEANSKAYGNIKNIAMNEKFNEDYFVTKPRLVGLDEVDNYETEVEAIDIAQNVDTYDVDSHNENNEAPVPEDKDTLLNKYTRLLSKIRNEIANGNTATDSLINMNYEGFYSNEGEVFYNGDIIYAGGKLYMYAYYYTNSNHTNTTQEWWNIDMVENLERTEATGVEEFYVRNETDGNQGIIGRINGSERPDFYFRVISTGTEAVIDGVSEVSELVGEDQKDDQFKNDEVITSGYDQDEVIKQTIKSKFVDDSSNVNITVDTAKDVGYLKYNYNENVSFSDGFKNGDIIVIDGDLYIYASYSKKDNANNTTNYKELWNVDGITLENGEVKVNNVMSITSGQVDSSAILAYANSSEVAEKDVLIDVINNNYNYPKDSLSYYGFKKVSKNSGYKVGDIAKANGKAYVYVKYKTITVENNNAEINSIRTAYNYWQKYYNKSFESIMSSFGTVEGNGNDYILTMNDSGYKYNVKVIRNSINMELIDENEPIPEEGGEVDPEEGGEQPEEPRVQIEYDEDLVNADINSIREEFNEWKNLNDKSLANALDALISGVSTSSMANGGAEVTFNSSEVCYEVGPNGDIGDGHKEVVEEKWWKLKEKDIPVSRWWGWSYTEKWYKGLDDESYSKNVGELNIDKLFRYDGSGAKYTNYYRFPSDVGELEDLTAGNNDSSGSTPVSDEQEFTGGTSEISDSDANEVVTVDISDMMSGSTVDEGADSIEDELDPKIEVSEKTHNHIYAKNNTIVPGNKIKLKYTFYVNVKTEIPTDAISHMSRIVHVEQKNGFTIFHCGSNIYKVDDYINGQFVSSGALVYGGTKKDGNNYKIGDKSGENKVNFATNKSDIFKIGETVKENGEDVFRINLMDKSSVFESRDWIKFKRYLAVVNKSIVDLTDNRENFVGNYKLNGEMKTPIKDSAGSFLRVNYTDEYKANNSIVLAEPGDFVTYRIAIKNDGTDKKNYGTLKDISFIDRYSLRRYVDDGLDLSEDIMTYISHDGGSSWRKDTVYEWMKNGSKYTWTGEIEPGKEVVVLIKYRIDRMSKTNDMIENNIVITDSKNINKVKIKTREYSQNENGDIIKNDKLNVFDGSDSRYESSDYLKLRIYHAKVTKDILTIDGQAPNANFDCEVGDRIVYKVTVKNTGVEPIYGKLYTINLRDVFDENKMYFIGVNSTNNEWSLNTVVDEDFGTTTYLLTNSKGIDVGEERSFELTTMIKLRSIRDGVPIENKAVIEPENSVTNRNDVNIRKVLNGDLEDSAVAHNLAYHIDLRKYIATNEKIDYDGRKLGRYDVSNKIKYDNPVEYDRGDTGTYVIRIQNTGDTKLYGIVIDDVLEDGLSFYKHGTSEFIKRIEFEHTENGTAIPRNLSVSEYIESAKIDENNHLRVKIKNRSQTDRLEVKPGDVLKVYIDFKVDKSNLYLWNLQNEVFVPSLVNKHGIEIRKDNGGSYVYDDDVIPQMGMTDNDILNLDINYNREFVRMKDLKVQGSVWQDSNRDGVMNSNEPKMQNIEVKLIDNTNNKQTMVLTDAEGKYQFVNTNGNLINSGADSGVLMVGDDNRVIKATNKDPVTGNYFYPGIYDEYKSDEERSIESSYINYYIEYAYNGARYIATNNYAGDSNLAKTATVGKDDAYRAAKVNGSEPYHTDTNATEFHDMREDFQTRLETINYNNAVSSDNDSTELVYDKARHISTIIDDLNVNPVLRMTAYSFVTDTAGWIRTSGNNDNIDYLWLNRNNGKVDNHCYSGETDYLKEINLGLKVQEIDLKLENDLYQVRTTVNGEEVVYDYLQGNNGAKSATYVGKYATGGKEAGNTFDVENYKFRFYSSDYNYRANQYANSEVVEYKQGTELDTELTYMITLTNDNTGLTDDKQHVYARINEITQFYPEQFVKFEPSSNNTKSEKLFSKGENTVAEYLNETTGLAFTEAYYFDEAGNRHELTLSNESNHKITNSLGSEIKNDASKANQDKMFAGYNKLYITGLQDIILDRDEKQNIFIKFTLDKDAAHNNNLKIDNGNTVAEINSYSTFEERTQIKDAQGKVIKSTISNPAGYLDINSNPGNLGFMKDNSGNAKFDELFNFKEYENDAYKTGLNMEVESTSTTTNNPPTENPPEELSISKKERAITGFVWDDARSDTTASGADSQYRGNGTYNEDNEVNEAARKNSLFNDKSNKIYNANLESKDNAVEGVKVKLVELVTVKDASGKETIYEETMNTSSLSQLVDVTDAEGKFRLQGFIPGQYIVRYEYGYKTDGTSETAKNLNARMVVFNGQDYKSTLYNPALDAAEITDTTNVNSKDGDKVLEALTGKNRAFGTINMTDSETRSDARDDAVRRLEVNGYSEYVNNEKSKTLQSPKYQSENILMEDKDISYLENELLKNTSMFADTPTFPVRIEDDNYIGDTRHYVFTDHQKIMYNVTESRYALDGIDFGVEYRPEADVDIDVFISEIKVSTSSKDLLYDLKYDLEFKDGNYVSRIMKTNINTKTSRGIPNAQTLYKDINQGIKGFIFLNVDADTMQGTTVEITYAINVNNISEVDRIGSELRKLLYEEDTKTLESADREMTGYNGTSQYRSTYTARNELAKGFNYNWESKESTKLRKKEVRTAKDYYGKYIGSTYYTGNVQNAKYVNAKDEVSMIKINGVLDYVDNDMVLDTSINNKENAYWRAVTSKELAQRGLIDPNIFKEVSTDVADSKRIADLILSMITLTDNRERRYDSEQNGSRLALVVDDSKDSMVTGRADTTLNKSITKFLLPEVNNQNSSSAYINIYTSKTLSSSSDTNDMSYDNIAEIVEYRTETGRVSTLASKAALSLNGKDRSRHITVGNANLAIIDDMTPGDGLSNTNEPDTAMTETVSLIPPTGRYKMSYYLRTHRDLLRIVQVTITLMACVPITAIVIKKRKNHKKVYK